MMLLPLLAALLAAPAPAKPAPVSGPTSAAVSAALAAQSEAMQKAVEGAVKAAESAAKAAESAAQAAESASKAADKAAEAAAKTSLATAAASAPAPVPAAPPAPVPPAPEKWTGLLGASLMALTGNANTLVFGSKASFDRKFEHWILGVKASATYGQTTQADVNQIVALQGGVLGRVDRRFSPELSSYFSAGIDADHLKSIEARPLAELGAALMWFDTKEGTLSKSSLRTDLGLRYGRELRFQYYVEGRPVPLDLADIDFVAPHLGLAFRYAISKDIIFTQDADVSVNLINEVRMLVNAQSKLSAKLTASTALTAQLGILHDTVPAAGTKNTDTMLSIGFDVAL